MNFLFLDSSFYLQFGLLNEKLEWVDFREIQNKKGSSVLHGELHEFLKKNNQQVKDIKKIILSGGPGSYTGIRLAEGMAQIFEWQNVEISSFYCFEIPYFKGIKKGCWCAEAFKSEIFLYEWNEDKSRHCFIKMNQFKDYISEKKKLYHVSDRIQGYQTESTTQLLKEYPQQIFSRVLKRKDRFKPFYFRSSEKEFKISNKYSMSSKDREL